MTDILHDIQFARRRRKGAGLSDNEPDVVFRRRRVEMIDVLRRVERARTMDEAEAPVRAFLGSFSQPTTWSPKLGAKTSPIFWPDEAAPVPGVIEHATLCFRRKDRESSTATLCYIGLSHQTAVKERDRLQETEEPESQRVEGARKRVTWEVMSAPSTSRLFRPGMVFAERCGQYNHKQSLRAILVLDQADGNYSRTDHQRHVMQRRVWLMDGVLAVKREPDLGARRLIAIRTLTAAAVGYLPLQDMIETVATRAIIEREMTLTKLQEIIQEQTDATPSEYDLTDLLRRVQNRLDPANAKLELAGQDARAVLLE